MSRRSGFQQGAQDVYLLPVVVEDSGYPAQSSTSTLQVRVCSCGPRGSALSCSAQAVLLPVGLSTGALMAVLLCAALLLGTEHTPHLTTHWGTWSVLDWNWSGLLAFQWPSDGGLLPKDQY